MSAGGGVENAPLNAARIGAKAFALFTKNQRQWKAKPLSPKSIQLFRENCEKEGYGLNRYCPTIPTSSTWAIRMQKDWPNPGPPSWMSASAVSNSD